MSRSLSDPKARQVHHSAIGDDRAAGDAIAAETDIFSFSQRGRSLGLKGMRERVHYHGGQLEVGRAPRGGTRVKIWIPVQQRLKEGAA